MTDTPTPFFGLAKLLLQANLIDQDTLTHACKQADTNKVSLARYLTTHKLLSSHTIADLLSDKLGEKIVNLDDINPQKLPTHLMDRSLLSSYEVLPLGQKDGQIFVATSDPTRTQAFHELRFHTRMHITPVLVDEAKLAKILHALNLAHGHDWQDLTPADTDGGDADGDITDNPDAPAVKFVQKILDDTVALTASDVHFEPFENHHRIRMRIDGIMKTITTLDTGFGKTITARLKVMANLDIAERRLPQDGRIKFTTQAGKVMDFRVSTLPTLFGEKIVLRALDSTQTLIGINELGMNPDQQARYTQALHQPQGMILITGPTGSGKTISLYTGLSLINHEQLNIQTVEDPIEIQMAGITQVAINPKINLDFADVLRAFLRQDPDVIMVGEIRDVQTAQIAIKAAQTGHLVLSTLHTNSAIDALIRLKNMGIASFNIASCVSLIIAQRLIRKLCNHCKRPVSIPINSLLELGFDACHVPDTLYEAVGCHRCQDGYAGRIGIYEMLSIDKNLAQLIMSDADSHTLLAYAEQTGFCSLAQSAMQQVILGTTSVQEMQRVVAHV